MTIVMRSNPCTGPRHDVVRVAGASAGVQPRRLPHHFRPFLVSGVGPRGPRGLRKCRALQSSEPKNAQDSGEEGGQSHSGNRIQSTISGLDELLGVVDQKEKTSEEQVGCRVTSLGAAQVHLRLCR